MRAEPAASCACFRDTEFTLSGGFTGNYLEDDPSGYVALGIYRSF
jgi:hypothetical protein